MRAYLTLLFLMIMTPNLYAGFWQNHAEGWHWYQDSKEIAPEKSKVDASQPKLHFKNATAELKKEQEILGEAKNEAILHPSENNIVRYIKLQTHVVKQGARFADVWQLALLHHPELDYRIAHPSSQVGRQVYLKMQNQKQIAAIHKLSLNYGLFFIFRSGCHFCQRFAPLVKDFANRFGFKVIPISQDGRGLPEFPNPRFDKGISASLNTTKVPALFLVNPRRRIIEPISYGIVSEETIAQRVFEAGERLAQKGENL